MPRLADSSPSRESVTELFSRLAAIYGHSWTSAHGVEDFGDTWLHGLAGLTPEQFGIGLRRCIQVSQERARAGESDWPPTLGVFRYRCEEPDPSRVRDEFPALPKPEPNPQVMAFEVDRMKTILRSGA